MKDPKLRTIRKALAEIKKGDPETSLSEKALRRLISDGKIPCVEVGQRQLVDVNTIKKYLATGEKKKANISEKSANIQMRMW